MIDFNTNNTKLAVLFLIFIVFAPIVNCDAQRWQQGCYYTNDGLRVEGQIRHVFNAKFGMSGDNSIVYRSEKGAKKQKFDSYEIKSFVINSDSFMIAKSFKINAFANYSRDFAKVLIPGKITLLLHHTTASNGGGGGIVITTPVTTYLVHRRGKTSRMSTNKDFKEVLPTFLKGAPEIIEKIQSKEYTKPHLRKIIREYNSKFDSKT